MTYPPAQDPWQGHEPPPPPAPTYNPHSPTQPYGPPAVPQLTPTRKLAPVTGKKVGRKGWLGIIVSAILVLCCCGSVASFGDDGDDEPAAKPDDSASISTRVSPRQVASPAPSPSPSRTASAKPKPSPSVYFADCDAVADAGLYEIRKGEPGYRKALDRNGDGVACDFEDDPASADDSSGDDGGDAYYANCSEARAAGAAPIQRGEPGYRKGLDRDGDGTACD
ncbi:excalibur calcium-binding domain-containing protein [Micromonospora psammae]|uniref:excalibur calcium-binding domain-containing protein n=1 Tax=Micromonospora sp. CPCC 205556 TaxID=3122398 RepID=UPI002FF295D8